MKKILKRYILVTLILTIVMSSVPAIKAEAASKNITIEQYTELLVKAMKVTVDKSQDDPYIAAALKTGLLEKENEFVYSKQMTRTECAVLTNRADIYRHGNEVTKLYDNIVDLKRISDLSKVTKKYRDDVVQVFGKGIIVGYTNGKCTQEREFRGSNKITYNGAKAVVQKLINENKRSVMSPDGQLTRTTKLPVNAKEFDYILASFPNDFYEMKFNYELGKRSHKPEEMQDYSRPVMMKNYKNYKNTVKLFEWCEVIKKNLTYRLNVNYKTIDAKWVEKLNKTFDMDKTNSINNYVKAMKQNKVIIKASDISVEPSTLYLADGYYCIRVYAKFKVTSASDIKNTLIFGDIYMPSLKLNQWNEGYYDIKLNGKYNGIGYDYKVSSIELYDGWVPIKTKLLKPVFNKQGDEDFPDGYYYFK